MEKANELYKRMIEIEPSDPRGLLGAAEVAFAMGDKEKAKDFLSELAKAVAANPGLGLVLTGIYMREKDYTNAMNMLDMIVEIRPDNPAFKIMKASMHIRHDEMKEAERLFADALALNRKFAPAHMLGVLYLAQGKYETAVRFFEKTVEEIPRWHLAKVLYGVSLQSAGDLDRAIAVLQDALEQAITPSNHDLACRALSNMQGKISKK